MRSWTLGAFVAAVIGWALAWGVLASEPEAAVEPLRAVAPAKAPFQAKAALVAQGEAPLHLRPHALSWIDDTSLRTIDDVAGDPAIPWTPRRPGQIDRIDGKALWVRFDASVPAGPPWFLEVGAAGIDSARLFYRDARGAWVEQEAGDLRPTATWPFPGRHPTFALAGGDPQPTRYWLRVENRRLDFGAPLLLYPQRTLMATRDREQFLLGGYFGVAALLALAALAGGIVYHDRAFRAYSLYVAVVGLSLLARAGIGAEHLWPGWPYWNDLAVYSWPGLPVAATLWFVRRVTEPVRLSRTLDTAVWGLVAAVLVAVAADAVLRTRVSLNAVLMLTGLSLAAMAGMLVWGWADGRDRDVRRIAACFLPVVALAMFPLARAFNLIPTSELTQNAMFFGTVVQMPLLFYVLQLRGQRRRESQVRAAALSHADPLTGLPHRRALLERLDRSLTRARSHKASFALLAVRVVNLPQIESEFGRDACDKALVLATSHLKRASEDTDLAARVGDHAFVLLLEGVVEGPMAISRAQQVVASGLRPSPALPPGVTLKFHVAAALLPHNALDGLGVLQWLEDGIEQIARDGPKAIKALNF